MSQKSIPIAQFVAKSTLVGRLAADMSPLSQQMRYDILQVWASRDIEWSLKVRLLNSMSVAWVEQLFAKEIAEGRVCEYFNIY